MVINSFLWGSSYIWSKMLLGYLPYFTILFVFSLGGLAATSIIFCKRIKKIDKKTVLIGIGIGGLSILSNIFCMLALKSTSSSNTAFIVQMSVVMTPLIMAIAERKLPGKRVVFSVLVSMAGLLLLTCDFSHFSFNPGDLFALCNALFFSLYLAALKLYSGRTDPAQFTFIQHATGTVVFLGMALVFELRQIYYGGLDALALGILAISTAISVSTILIQSSAIKFVRPEKATVIYTLEPVTAAILGFAILGEKLAGGRALAGCVLILVSIAVTVYRKRTVTDGIGKDAEYAGSIGMKVPLSQSMQKYRAGFDFILPRILGALRKACSRRKLSGWGSIRAGAVLCRCGRRTVHPEESPRPCHFLSGSHALPPAERG